MKDFWLGLLVVGLVLQAPAPFRLDAAGGVGGLRFDESAGPGMILTSQFSGIGKRWRTTALYHRPGDTTQLGGLGAPDAYWFRANRFIGIDKQLASPAAIQQAYQLLTARYGPARADTVPDSWYWLGQRSYILLEKTAKKRGFLFIASLGMLNEQVQETAVRARARRLLGWRPDSLGLPRQYPVR